MHIHGLSLLIDAYNATPTRDMCQKLLLYIRRHSLDAHFPLWFRCSELATRHQLQDLYGRTFQSPVFTRDEYKTMTNILLSKGCTLPCIHQIYMYMLNPKASARDAPTRLASDVALT